MTELKANIIIGMRLEIQAEHIKRISSNIGGRDHYKENETREKGVGDRLNSRHNEKVTANNTKEESRL